MNVLKRIGRALTAFALGIATGIFVAAVLPFTMAADAWREE